MTAGPQATGVGDFGDRAGPLALGDILGQLHQPQHLAADLAAEAGGEVALDAGDILVGGGLPRAVVGPHDVATIAELRAGGVPAGQGDRHQNQEEKGPQHRGGAPGQPTDLPPGGRGTPPDGREESRNHDKSRHFSKRSRVFRDSFAP